MKTNTKEFNQLAFNYIIDAISTDGYDIEANTETEKLQFIADCFKSEYCFPDNLKYYGTYQNTLANWFMGLPSSINIEFRNHAIIEIAKKWGSIPKDATEKQEDKIISNWFNLIAFKTLQLFKKHNISIY
jgi:hypothetical protein